MSATCSALAGVALVGLEQAEQRPLVEGRLLQDRLQLADRLVAALELLKAERAHEADVQVPRDHLEDFAVGVVGLREPIGLDIQAALHLDHREVALGVLRAGLQALLGLLVLLELDLDVGQLHPGVEARRLLRDDREILLGHLRLLHPERDLAETLLGQDEGGPLLLHLLEEADRVAGVALPLVESAEIVVGVAELRVRGDHGLEVLLGGAEVLAVVGAHARLETRPGAFARGRRAGDQEQDGCKSTHGIPNPFCYSSSPSGAT